jgi:hypothetical protein
LKFPLNSYPGKFDLDWDGMPDKFDRDWLVHYLDAVNDFRKERGAIVAVNEYGIVRWVPGAAEYLDDQMALFEEMGINYAIWMWDPAWIPWTDEVNAMNYRFGVDPKIRSDQMPNPLMDVLQKYWENNNIHPSDYYIK